MWGSFAGEGTAGGGRLGQGKVAGSMVAPPWLNPCAYALVGSGGGCQEARGDLAPGQIGRQRPFLLSKMQGRLWKQECLRQTEE